MEPRAIQKAKRRDRIARWVITGGGMLIIFTVIGIFFLIVEVTIPLFLPPQATLWGIIHLLSRPAYGCRARFLPHIGCRKVGARAGSISGSGTGVGAGSGSMGGDGR